MNLKSLCKFNSWNTELNKDFIYKIICIIIPFLFHYAIVMRQEAIWNDFHIYYQRHLWAIESWADGAIPFWNPTEDLGIMGLSATASPLSPSTPIFVLLTKLGIKITPYIYEIYTLFGVSIFILGIYLWLKSEGIRKESAFMSSIVIGLSWNFNLELRYPPAIYVIAFIPVMLYILKRISDDYSKSKEVAPLNLLMLFLSVLFILSGHFVFSVYAVAALAIYILLRYKISDLPIRKIFFTISMAVGALSLFIVNLAYELQFMMDRHDPNILLKAGYFKLEYFRNILYPYLFVDESISYFGTATLLLITLSIISIFYNKKWRNITLITTLSLLLYVLFLLSLPYDITYKIPVLGNIRETERGVVAFFPFLAMLISIGYENLIDIRFRKKNICGILIFGLIIFLIQFLLYLNNPSNKLTIEGLNQDFGNGVRLLVATIVSIIFLIFLVLNNSFRKITFYLLILFILIDIGNPKFYFANEDQLHPYHTKYERLVSNWTYQGTQWPVESTFFKRHFPPSSYDLQRASPFHMYFTRTVPQNDDGNLARYFSQESEACNTSITKEIINGEGIKFIFQSACDGYLIHANSALPGWSASVYQKDVPLIKVLDDTFYAIKLDRGEHEISFQFEPFHGKVVALISFLFLASFFMFLVIKVKSEKKRT